MIASSKAMVTFADALTFGSSGCPFRRVATATSASILSCRSGRRIARSLPCRGRPTPPSNLCDRTLIYPVETHAARIEQRWRVLDLHGTYTPYRYMPCI